MPTARLTPHFDLSEFTSSQEAARRGLDNTPTELELSNLKNLAATMEQVRVILGAKPILISSGYRSHKVNSAVGGAANSAHMSGLACDFTCPGFGTPLAICKAIEPFMIELGIDQLIWEFASWVHLGLPAPRYQKLTIDNNGTRNGFG